ncbi:exonuclease SbcCD subunit D [Methylomonas rapida]|uniref:Nuclease SbcCD subunit D n=1 Tax=Methylomonas rapida TaxID=2963939 RepID=A0ABY7GII1_9GAMM|nr:exonuclease SbcCD subunit D [Methylomonas rapida]WAR43668.1 exonuclease SbcCD subunit D C-terminal domain-containing protein [Methylomonas rapida]
MKIFHTSDWHLGQSLRGFDRYYEHQCFLDWLLAQIRTEDIDVLLVSGDIFDNANPSSASQKQLYRFLQAAREAAPHLRVVLIAGNHDSPGRLEAPSPLLARFETRVVGQTARIADGNIDLEQLIIPLHDRNDQLRAWCLAVPFLRPGDVPRIESEQDAYLAGVEALYQQALQQILLRRHPGQAIVALGHCHLEGGATSRDSERRIVVGGLEALSAGIFDKHIAYAALGHLHLPQAVGGREWVRYSGSPLPMSFAETEYPHQIVKIELDGERLQAITPLRVPRSVELLKIPAQPAPLPEVLQALQNLPYDDLSLPERQWPYLEVRVSFETPEPGARALIEEAIKHKAVRLAGIDANYRRGDGSMHIDEDSTFNDLSQLQAEDILRQHHQTQYGGPVPDDVMKAFQELLLEAEL